MLVRLGFSIATFLEPDVLLVDEILAVGDANFQQKCLQRVSEIVQEGTTLLYVSHDLASVEASSEGHLAGRRHGPGGRSHRRGRQPLSRGNEKNAMLNHLQ